MMMTFDFIISGLIASAALYIYFTGKIDFPTYLLGFLCSVGTITTIYIQGASVAYWAYPLTIVQYYIFKPKVAFWLNTFTLIGIFPPCYASLNSIELASLLITLFTTNMFCYTFAVQTDKSTSVYEEQALKDGLTGTLNRRAMDNRFTQIEKGGLATSLIIFDIDRFKKINDQYGHLVGDDLLIKLSSTIKQELRAEDGIYRYGGEEFVVIAPNTPLSSAHALAEKLREHVENEELLADRKVTISLGVAELMTNESIHDCFQRCDEALYNAKSSGRNRTCIAA
ncbi:GGDEF domain-containing protein [Thalassotalea sp. LPB0316]|uniref:GGDEF domain-containing protein n=1 Tax=Thalassotalea sp. LPB0316 TaxID=2769490 RepID=UPI0018681273|nr:GGDEF domain-containing protein [Thalassotalea sp. LPB0316]QOL24651.1 GGDEF domain-containing protein [Thalassotalea sp. LPB0316]